MTPNGARSQAWDEPTKQRALEIAERDGAAAASRETGIPAATIRYWRHKTGEVQAPAGVDPASWAQAKEEGARASWAAGKAALREALRAIEEGRTLDAQRLMVSAGIAADKTGQLTEAAERAQERQVALAEGQARRLLEIVEHLCDELAIPWEAGGPVARLFAAIVRDENRADVAEEAKRIVREAIGREYLAERGEAPPPRAPLALPAPRPHPDQRDDEEHEPHD